MAQRYDRFAREYVRTGCGAEAYRRAGFMAKTPSDCHKGASRLLKRPDVQQMVGHYREKWLSNLTEADAELLTETVGTVKALIALRDRAENEQVRLRACVELLDRAGVLKTRRKTLDGETAKKMSLVEILEMAMKCDEKRSEGDQGVPEEVPGGPGVVLGDDSGEPAVEQAEGDTKVGEG